MYISVAALLTAYFIVFVVTCQSISFPENNHVADVNVSTCVWKSKKTCLGLVGSFQSVAQQYTRTAQRDGYVVGVAGRSRMTRSTNNMSGVIRLCSLSPHNPVGRANLRRIA